MKFPDWAIEFSSGSGCASTPSTEKVKDSDGSPLITILSPDLASSPGPSESSAVMSRRFIGSSATMFSDIWTFCSALVVFSSGVSDSTVIISVIAPTVRTETRLRSSPEAISTPVSVYVLKPSRVMWTSYTPGRRKVTVYAPRSFVTTSRDALFAVFTTVTVAPGTTASGRVHDAPVDRARHGLGVNTNGTDEHQGAHSQGQRS